MFFYNKLNKIGSDNYRTLSSFTDYLPITITTYQGSSSKYMSDTFL